MSRNYYVVLGVDTDATQGQIKSAYRRKAKQLHPDYREGSTKPFRDVQEAYEILSDPERRRVYDDEFARVSRPYAPLRGVGAEPLRSRRCPVEPLVPREQPTTFGETFSGWPSGTRSTLGIDGLWSDLGGWVWPGTRDSEELEVVIPLTREQAMRGGRVRVSLSLQTRCPRCRGAGDVGFYACWACAGAGTVVEQCPVRIAFPAGVSDDTVARLSLARLGVPYAYLTVRFDVRGR